MFLFNDTLNTFFILRLYGVGHMVKDLLSIVHDGCVVILNAKTRHTSMILPPSPIPPVDTPAHLLSVVHDGRVVVLNAKARDSFGTKLAEVDELVGAHVLGEDFEVTVSVRPLVFVD